MVKSTKGVLRLLPRWLAAAAAAALLTGGAAGQDAADSADYPEVEVELGGPLFKQVLPFDVPFFISGEVPAGTRCVAVRYVEHDGFFRVEPAEPAPGDVLPCAPPDAVRAAPAAASGGRGSGDGPECWQPEERRARRAADLEAREESFDCSWTPPETRPALTWSRFGDASSAAAETFRIAVPPLDAKRYYVFRFDVLADPTPEALAAFESRARVIVDQRLARVAGVDAFGRDVEGLRRDLLTALEGAAGRDRLAVEPQSLFHLGTSWADLRWTDKQQFLEAVNRVMIAQQRRSANEGQRAADAVQLAGDLTAVGADAAFDGLLDALDAAAGPPAAAAASAQADLLRDLLDAYQGPLALAHLDAAAAQRLARGGEPASDAPPPELGTATTDPAAAAAAAANYAATRAELARLEELLGRLLPSGRSRHLVDAQVAAGRLTAAEVAALPELASRVGVAQEAAGRLANEASQIAAALAARAAALDAVAATLKVAAADVGILVQGTTLGSFKTQQKWYISADFGFALAPDASKTVPYAGTNVYTRPVNKDAPLSSRGGFRRRFAFTLGLTVASIDDADPQTRRDLFASNSLLLGAGYRVTDAMRLGGGALLFEAEDPNPLVETWDLTTSYYLSLSFDWDVLGFFRNFGPIFGQP
jgi:hypothetical protein